MGESVCRRVFLGWDGPFLPRAAQWLAQQGTADLSSWRVVVPSARAGRILLAELAGRMPRHWVPPLVRAEGELALDLARARGRAASPLAQRLAWGNAARAVAPEVAHAWQARAFDLRCLLARDGVACDERALAQAARAWLRALPNLESGYREELARAGLEDPLESAWSAGPGVAGMGVDRLVLAGLIQPSALTRRACAGAAGAVSLVAAPAAERDAFDEWGAARVEHWNARALELADDAWRTLRGPAEVGGLFADWLAQLGQRRAALASEQLSVGLLDPEYEPGLAGVLARVPLAVHRARGERVEHSPVGRWLAALEEWLSTRSRAAWAALLRQPDQELALELELGVHPGSLAAWLDEDHRLHLQAESADDSRRTHAMQRAWAAIQGRLGMLARPERAPLSTCAGRLRELAAECFAQAPVPRAQRWIWAQSLRELGAVLDETEALAGTPLDALLVPSDALALIRGCFERARLAAPFDAGAVELLGWLDLPMDRAPYVFLCGLNEGRLPIPFPGGTDLGPAACEALGLDWEAAHRARDACALTQLCARAQELCLVSARHNARGDPLRPSRFLFRAASAKVAARIERFFAQESAPFQGPTRAPPRGGELLRRPEPAAIPSPLPASSFETFLRSPYQFYLRHVLGLCTQDDRAVELDPAEFGSLAHELLARFGTGPLAASGDELAIERWLRRELERLSEERFGSRCLPAVPVQLAQLESSLAGFARAQAQLFRDGWRIAEVEWLAQPIELLVDGQAVSIGGRIDRLDRHDGERRWRVIDYKTSNLPRQPGQAHSPRKGWIDLQLPLYRELVRPRCGGEPIELALFNLPGTAAGCGLALAQWSESELEAALEKARDCVRAMWRGAYFERGAMPWGEDWQAVEGRGAIAPPEQPAGAEGEAAGEDREDEP
jgi:hypothetical protein